MWWFPHIKQFSDTSWVSYTVTHLWHHLSGDRVRCHKLRTWSHKTCPNFKCQWQVQIVTCASDQLWIKGSHKHLLRFNHLLEWLTELRKAVSLLDYWFLTRDFKGQEKQARWRDTQGEVWKGSEHRSFWPHRAQVCHSPACGCLLAHQLGSSLNLVIRDF